MVMFAAMCSVMSTQERVDCDVHFVIYWEAQTCDVVYVICPCSPAIWIRAPDTACACGEAF